MSANTRASPMANAASEAMPGRLRSDETLRWLLRDDVLEGRPREYSEHRVVQGEKQKETPALRGHGSADSPDDERDREGEHEQRQEHLSRPAGDGHGRHERADGTDPDVGEQNAQESSGAERLKEEHERGNRDDLRRDQERKRRERLA